MQVDRANRIAYISDSAGSVHICDLQKDPPMLQRTVIVDKGANIRSLFIYPEKALMFACGMNTSKIYLLLSEDPKNPV